ncbi:MAG: flagellar basal-body MS-ring/collar protein FliF [Pseudomonadota bacterium]
MPEKARAFLKQLTDFWASLPTPKRIALVFFTTAVLIGVSLLSVVGSRDHFATLYSELSSEDAGQIVEKLKTQQVPYQLSANGTQILVPEEKVAGLRLELAAGGLPRGGSVGFEIFDRSRIGATEFEQNINLRRALEGELARSVMSVDGVKNARVHLVLPEHRLFASREESASASVVVKLTNSANFGRREVAAVVYLVSMAVPGLSKDRVSVVSTEGLTLHRPNSDASGGGDLAGEGAEQSRVIASQLEGDAQAQLERVVGPGNADVRVNVELNPAAKERTEELYEPSKTALRSEHVVQESNGTSEAGVAGVPGAKANLPDAKEGENAEVAPPTGGGGVRRSQTRNWEVQRITQKTTTPPGEIRRLSVAVVLNGRYEKHGEKSVFVPRSPDEVLALSSIVKHAVGFSAERGDEVELRAVQFARLDAGEDATVLDPLAKYRRYLPFALGGLVAVVLLASIIMAWRRGKAKKAAAALALAAPVITEGQLGGLITGTKDNTIQLGTDRARTLLLEDAPPASDEIRARALELAAKDPATAAVVLRRWLSVGAPAALPAE